MGAEARIRRNLRAVVLVIGSLSIVSSALGQEIRFFPIRSGPIGSACGTVGSDITPTWNSTLGCWEHSIAMGGVEVDIDVQGGGWGSAVGAPALGAIQATVVSAGYSNGVGCDLSPKGWPGTPLDGAYQATNVCGAGGDGAPCVPPFDITCAGNGICIPNPDWVFRPNMAANDLAAPATPTCNYGYATARTKRRCSAPSPGVPRPIPSASRKASLSASRSVSVPVRKSSSAVSSC